LIRIFHKEYDMYICACNKKNNKIKLVEPSQLHSDYISLSCWEVERTNKTIGGKLRNSDEFLMKNIATGLYLSISLQRDIVDGDSSINNNLPKSPYEEENTSKWKFVTKKKFERMKKLKGEILMEDISEDKNMKWMLKSTQILDEEVNYYN
jgi:CRISPR/Cas system-associated protein endoribonuclease Cas2